MQATPRVHIRVTRNNTPGMLPKASQQARSKGEHNNENSMKLATSEGEKLEATEVIASNWYKKPREKRGHVTKENAKPARRLKIFTPEQNAQLNKVEIIGEKASAAEQPNFGLGLQNKRITRSNNSQAKQHRGFTPAPPSRSPRIISQVQQRERLYRNIRSLPMTQK